LNSEGVKFQGSFWTFGAEAGHTHVAGHSASPAGLILNITATPPRLARYFRDDTAGFLRAMFSASRAAPALAAVITDDWLAAAQAARAGTD
jgi:hypothetical protein